MRKRASLIILAILGALLCTLSPFEAQAASTPVFKPFHAMDGSLLIAIRSLDEGKETKYLAVDAKSLAASVVGKKELGKAASRAEWKATPYGRSLATFTTESLLGFRTRA